MKNKKLLYDNTAGVRPDAEDQALSTGQRIAAAVLDALFPRRCPLCDRVLSKKELFCCEVCEKKLPRVTQPSCMKCGKPVSAWEQEFCQDCRKYRHYFDQGAAAFTYTGAMRRSVYRMKRENRRDYLDFYAFAMAGTLKRYVEIWNPQCIAAVPMHWKKKRQRGYNQSELLARRISRETGIPTDFTLLRCTRAHTAQKLLNRKERLKNLQGSFAAAGVPEGARILVVDDVYTTGSTMDEIARVLKAAGAARVYFLVLCIGKGKNPVCTEKNVCYTKIK